MASRGWPPLLLLAAFTAVGVPSCGSASEGESCDRSNRDGDCEEGLICREAFEVRAGKSVCCPRPPARPSVSACLPAVASFEPDAAAGGGPAAGGATGSGGAAGSGGADGGSDASPDAPADGSGD